MCAPHRREVEAGERALATGGSQAATQGAVREQPLDRRGERARVAGRDEQPGRAVDHLLRDASDGRRDDRQPRGHRLQDGQRRALGAARQHEDVGCGEQRGTSPRLPRSSHRGRQAERPELRRQRRALRPIADDLRRERRSARPASARTSVSAILRCGQAADGERPAAVQPS